MNYAAHRGFTAFGRLVLPARATCRKTSFSKESWASDSVTEPPRAIGVSGRGGTELNVKASVIHTASPSVNRNPAHGNRSSARSSGGGGGGIGRKSGTAEAFLRADCSQLYFYYYSKQEECSTTKKETKIDVYSLHQSGTRCPAHATTTTAALR